MPAEEPVPAPPVSDPWDLAHQPRINQDPDLSAAHAYWDTTGPLVPIEEAWWGRGRAAPAVGEPVMNGDTKQVRESPAQVAREMRLRAEAARQVAESRAARGVL